MKTTTLVKDIGSAAYLRYSRAKLLNIVEYSRGFECNFEEAVRGKDYGMIDKILKRKLPSYYAAKHEGFKSLAEYWGGKKIVEMSSEMQKARREFTVKPASWFKSADATAILMDMTKECEIKTVLDPFNGWGARAAAAASLGMRYQGWDANQLLQMELVGLFKPFGDQIKFENVNSFDNLASLDGVDAVLTCPPYWIAEEYGYRIQKTSYKRFVTQLVELLSSMKDKGVKIIAVSLENFCVGGKRYSFESDFTDEASRVGFTAEERVYRRMKRTFNNDFRDLKYFMMRR